MGDDPIDPGTFDRALATEQIRRIILSYPELVDRGDLDGVGRLLDGVHFGSASGRNAPVIPLEQLTGGRASRLLSLVDRWITDVRAHATEPEPSDESQ